MGDENFSLEGLTVEEIKRAMPILQAKRAKAYAELKKLDADIDEVKSMADKLPFKIVSPYKTELLNVLNKKRAHLNLYIYALEEVFKTSQRALKDG